MSACVAKGLCVLSGGNQNFQLHTLTTTEPWRIIQLRTGTLFEETQWCLPGLANAVKFQTEYSSIAAISSFTNECLQENPSAWRQHFSFASAKQISFSERQSTKVVKCAQVHNLTSKVLHKGRVCWTPRIFACVFIFLRRDWVSSTAAGCSTCGCMHCHLRRTKQRSGWHPTLDDLQNVLLEYLLWEQ